MTEFHYQNTSTNMVQAVRNIIDGYGMGSIRALAQEPVQNAKDAGVPGNVVQVEYRLIQRHSLDGTPCYLLTVTDSGTTGLRGPILSPEDLQERNYKLTQEENWAAFEGQGYTKENEDALGSRGQGKAAFLYHSHLPGNGHRMLMLYDTLLENGEYRLGVRFARPIDQVRRPLFDYEASSAVQDVHHEIFDNHFVPLALQPLTEVGSRIIVPFLTEEAFRAISSGELSRWLQRCWWRAIQKRQLRITVVDEEHDTKEVIKEPSWWCDLPKGRGGLKQEGEFLNLDNGASIFICGDIRVQDGHGIQRLALLYDEKLKEDEIIDDHPEYSGIQLLRGNQWIETRGSRAEYGDLIPRDKRPGFRGFVEFFRDTDAELRKTENSQHDGFDGRTKLFRDLRQALLGKVGEFSTHMGWEQEGDETPKEVSQREKRVHAQFLQTFTQPKHNKKPSSESKPVPDGLNILWDCRLDLDFPDVDSARVDWGQKIRNVYIEVSAEPAEEIWSNGSVRLEWVDTKGNRLEVWRREANFIQENQQGRIMLPFEAGDWQLIKGKAKRGGQISCPDEGIHRLRAVVEYQGEKVKESTRTIYVQMDPPPPSDLQPIALSIAPRNESDPEQKRIEHGQVLLLQINATNRKTTPERVYLNARIDEELLARNLLVDLPATPAGDTPQRIPALVTRRRLLDPVQIAEKWKDDIAPLVMKESSYRSVVIAELLDSQGNPVLKKPIRQTVYFQLEPGKKKGNLPFEIKQKSEVSHAPMWEMNDRLDELSYSGNYPLYKELSDVQRLRRPLQGRDAFTAEICANGLLEWALRPLPDGDESNFGQLMDAMWETDGNAADDLWERYQIRLENLANQASNSTHIEFSKVWRETVAMMLEIFRQEAS